MHSFILLICEQFVRYIMYYITTNSRIRCRVPDQAIVFCYARSSDRQQRQQDGPGLGCGGQPDGLNDRWPTHGVLVQ